MKSISDMTTDEFAQELKRLNDMALEISNSVSGTRQDRSYRNAKRGNFHGNQQKDARQKLQSLNGMVASGTGKYG